ncbi:MAG: amidase [Pseudomonadota bacterium]
MRRTWSRRHAPLMVGFDDPFACRNALRDGAISALDTVNLALTRIDAADAEIQAFAWCDPDAARREAEALDRERGADGTGALHGMPVALKDVVDTAGIPTENGVAADRRRVPTADAVIVERLRAEGAVLIGKTVTAELAFLSPGATRNPVNPAHTPGGSSSGSAAAVASGMAPFAIGTQTGGSVIRPASFCGIVGYKPSFGAIPRTGVLSQSPSLDTLGVFAQTVAGAALVAEPLFGVDAGDPESRWAPRPALLDAAMNPAPTFRLAFVPPPDWESRAQPEMRAGFARLRDALGARCRESAPPESFGAAAATRLAINLAEMAHEFRRYAGGATSAALQEALAAGAQVTAQDYLAAKAHQRGLAADLRPLFEDVDAIVTPAALGAAPMGIGSTGDSLFNGLWTLAGVPAITLPLLASPEGLPLGVQLVGQVGEDARLLRTAAALERWAKHALE